MGVGETEHEGESFMGILSANVAKWWCLKKSHLQISCTLRATLRFPAGSGLYMAYSTLLEPVGSASRRQHGIQGTVSNLVQLHISQ